LEFRYIHIYRRVEIRVVRGVKDKLEEKNQDMFIPGNHYRLFIINDMTIRHTGENEN